MKLTKELLAQAAQVPVQLASGYVDALNNALARFNITDPVEIAAIISQFSHETQRFQKMEEDLYYRDAERIANIFKRQFDINQDGKISPEEIAAAQPYVKNSAKMSQKLYGGFHGRGMMQLTWEGNYRKIGEMVGKDYVSKPTLLLQPIDACLSGVAFWVMVKGNETYKDPKATRLKINGKALLGLDDTTAVFNDASKILVAAAKAGSVDMLSVQLADGPAAAPAKG